MFVKFVTSSTLLFLLLKYVSLEEQPIVDLPDGKIKGIAIKSRVTNSSRLFYSFLGVRYARPPIGNLRFQSPESVLPWNDVYDATYEKNICYQVTQDSDQESEDCLFLNLYTPKIPKSCTNLLPVMIFIHGGGNIQGSGLMSGVRGIGPDFFMDYGVILISINYRLGPFGFFSTGDAILPGNFGLKDQHFAIKWVNENIRYFGGDPKKITIFGQSSGASSVAYQTLSSKSSGLFRAAICQSGSALVPWNFQRNQTNITYATAAIINGTFGNFNKRNSSELLSFLLNVSAKDLKKASFEILKQETLRNKQILQGFFYAPVIEVEHNNAFITKLMYESFEHGQYNGVPLMIGINAEEALGIYDSNINNTLQDLVSDSTLLVPNDMHLSEDNRTIVGNLIKKKYITMPTDREKSIAGVIKFFTDHCFSRPIIRQAELQSQHSDVYFYMFTYHGLMGGNNITFPGTGNVSHSEEIGYLFVSNVNSQTGDTISTSNLTSFPEEDLKVHYRLLKLWINFAKEMNPTPRQEDLLQNILWSKVNVTKTDNIAYLDIGSNLFVKRNPKATSYKFWSNIYDLYGVKPYDTF